jgi:hypothetical protein
VEDVHDWLVVTGAGEVSAPEEDESKPDDDVSPAVGALVDEGSVAPAAEEDVPADGVAVAAAFDWVAVLAPVPLAWVWVVFAFAEALSAGSCPLARRTKITPHATTNTTRVTTTTRRRIVRMRCRRARSRWRPSRRDSAEPERGGGIDAGVGPVATDACWLDTGHHLSSLDLASIEALHSSPLNEG